MAENTRLTLLSSDCDLSIRKRERVIQLGFRYHNLAVHTHGYICKYYPCTRANEIDPRSCGSCLRQTLCVETYYPICLNCFDFFDYECADKDFYLRKFNYCSYCMRKSVNKIIQIIQIQKRRRSMINILKYMEYCWYSKLDEKRLSKFCKYSVE